METPLDRMMDFDLTPEQRQIRAAVRDFAEKEIQPFVEQYEREARYPLELIQQLVPLGYITSMKEPPYSSGIIGAM